MTSNPERDPGTDSFDPTMQRLTADLRAACAVTLPPRRREEIARTLSEEAARRGPAGRRQGLRARLSVSLPGVSPGRSRLASLAAAGLVIAGGAIGYLHLQAPTPASADQILRRAAVAMSPSPGEVVHERTSYTYHQIVAPEGKPPSLSQVSPELWAELGPGRTVERLDVTVTVDGVLREHEVVNEQGVWSYVASQNTVYKSPPSRPQPTVSPDGTLWPKALLLQPEDPAALQSLIENAAQRPGTRLLPQRTVDGRPVDVVQVTHREPDTVNGAPVDLPPYAPKTEIFTFYIDASTYLVQRLDEQDVNTAGATVGTATVRIPTYETMPPSTVPAGIFTFTPPPGATIETCTATQPPACTASKPGSSR